jgi:glutaredoxin
LVVRIPLLLGLVLGGLPAGSAGIYKWIDADGRVQFSDRPPSGGRAEEVRLPPLNTYEGVSVERLPEMSTDRAKGGRANRVVMYSASWCGVCKRAKRFFEEQRIPFRELDVDINQMARREMERMEARGVPVILVGGKRMNGFSEQRFMDLYGR